jgi:small acid-soluble spore protein I (minor)
MLNRNIGNSAEGAGFVNLNLRQAIVSRVKDKNEEELRDIIQDSVGNAEVTLPGLGVLFEIIWRDSAEEDRQKMVSALHRHLQGLQSSP